MPNLQPLIDNLPTILVGLGFVLWALARLVDSKAKANPAQDKWDELSPKIQWASHLYSQALDWLTETKALNFAGQEKLAELNRLVKSFEDKLNNGDVMGAINECVGYWTAAKNKLNKILPPASVPQPGGQTAGDSKPR